MLVAGKANIVAKSNAGNHKVAGLRDASKVPIDGIMPFVICSKRRGRSRIGRWEDDDDEISTKTFLIGGRAGGLSTSAFAQAAAPTPWELKSDMGYAYGKDGKTLPTRWAPTMPARC
jgi:hypothetical protein